MGGFTMWNRSGKAGQRWQPRVTVRLLMALVFMLSLFIGWKANRAHTQREVVAAVERAGGSVQYDYESNGDEPKGERVGDFVETQTPVEPPAPAWLRRLLGDEYFQEVVKANFSGLEVKKTSPQMRETALTALKRLDTLQGLSLTYHAFTKKELAHLRTLASLRYLSLRYCSTLTDADLACLDGLRQIKNLDVQGTSITGGGMAYLRGLNQLEELDLSYTNITDAGLAYLKNHPRLRRLDRVLPAGV